jgi:hypothetical protein
MRALFTVSIAALALFACTTEGLAQQPNYYNIPLQGAPPTYVQPYYYYYVNPNMYVKPYVNPNTTSNGLPAFPSLRPGTFIQGPYISPFSSYIQVRPYSPFMGPDQPAPAFYWDPSTNTYRYGRGYYTPLSPR